MKSLYRLVTLAQPAGYARSGNLSGMSLAARVVCLAGFAGLGVAILLAFAGGSSLSPAERITTDTPAYCQLLLERVHELAVPLQVEMGVGTNWRDLE